MFKQQRVSMLTTCANQTNDIALMKNVTLIFRLIKLLKLFNVILNFVIIWQNPIA